MQDIWYVTQKRVVTHWLWTIALEASYLLQLRLINSGVWCLATTILETVFQQTQRLLSLRCYDPLASPTIAWLPCSASPSVVGAASPVLASLFFFCLSLTGNTSVKGYLKAALRICSHLLDPMAGEAVTGLKSDALDKCEHSLTQCVISKQDGFYFHFHSLCYLHVYGFIQNNKNTRNYAVCGVIVPNCFIFAKH